MPAIKKDKNQWSNIIRARIIHVMRAIVSEKKDVRSYAAFARRIHTTPAAVSRWENQAGYPTIENIADICTEFHVSPDYLILGKGTMYGDAEVIVRLNNLERRVATIEKKVGE